MNDRDELERTLRSLDLGPRARTRDTILHSFDANAARPGSARRSRPVTLLRVLAATLVVVVIFFAGRWSTQAPQSQRGATRPDGTEVLPDLAWAPASVDLLRVVGTTLGRPSERDLISND